MTCAVYPDGSQSKYIYDADKKLKTVIAGGKSIFQNEYDEGGNITGKHDSDGREEFFSYSSKNLLIERKMRLNIKDWRSETWQRDMAGRILTHDVNGQVTSYAYDEESPVPSMIKTPCGYKFTCFYDKVFRLLTIKTEVGDKFKLIRWKYDLNDNCIERREWSDLQSRESATGRVKIVRYEYDAQNRLVKKFDGDTLTKYHYDCLNRLTKKVVKVD